MDFDWTIIAWIAGLIFVYGFGLFEGRGQGYKKRKAEEAEEKRNQPAPAAEPVDQPASPQIVTVDDPGLLRIKDESGAFALDLDGVRVNPSSLTSDQRRRLIEMLNIMRPWLEGRAAPAPAVSPRPSTPSPSSSPTTLDERLSTFGGSPGPGRSAPSQPAAEPPASRPSTIAKEDRPAAPAHSIVSQIDSILQARLEGTSLQDRGIFLTQSPEGGVMVYVGLTRYNAIDDVPDPEIKSAIRAAISEWENKYTPGL